MSVTEPKEAHKREIWTRTADGARPPAAQVARWLMVLVVLAGLFAAQTVALHEGYAARVGSAADFQPRWYATRALLFEGRDPYSPEVTAEIEAIRDPGGGHDFSYSFAYPLHVVFTFMPVAFLNYDWAQAVWTAALVWVGLGASLGMLAVLRWKPTLAAMAGLMLGTLLFYPVARSIILGQFTLHVTLFVVVALLLIQRERFGWAGVMVAATSIKPQMVIVIVPWFLVWALWRRERRFLAGFFGGGGIMLAASLLLLPRWPLSFWEDVGRYADLVSGGRYPLQVLFEAVLGTAPLPAMLVAGGLLLAGLLRAWARALARPSGAHFEMALFWAITVGLLIPFQTGSTNQAILLVPFLTWLRGAAVLRNPFGAAAFVGIAFAVPWALFLGTVVGNAEQPVLALPLPLLSLAILAIEERRLALAGTGGARPEMAPTD